MDTQVVRALRKLQDEAPSDDPMQSVMDAKGHSPRVDAIVLKGIFRFFNPTWNRTFVQEEGPNDGRPSTQRIEYFLRPLDTSFRVLP